jgi:hypothetical protein
VKLNRILVCILLLAGVLIIPGEHDRATAYDTTVIASLKKSKDALLTQKNELLDACDKRKAQVDQLQQEIDRLQGYIRDTDRTLRDIDIALSRT